MVKVGEAPCGTVVVPAGVMVPKRDEEATMENVVGGVDVPGRRANVAKIV